MTECDRILIAQIAIQHEMWRQRREQTVHHALTVGRILMNVRNRLGDHAWLDWVRTNTQVPAHTARRYLRLAEKWPASMQVPTAMHLLDAINEVMDDPNETPYPPPKETT